MNEIDKLNNCNSDTEEELFPKNFIEIARNVTKNMILKKNKLPSQENTSISNDNTKSKDEEVINSSSSNSIEIKEIDVSKLNNKFFIDSNGVEYKIVNDKLYKKTWKPLNIKYRIVNPTTLRVVKKNYCVEIFDWEDIDEQQ